MAAHGAATLSQCPQPADHRRWRRQQRIALRLWKIELQKLADELGLAITVCHLPPGTSKWNKIEHRLFSFITQNWRGKPLISHQVIVQLIAATTTKNGLDVRAEIDPNTYQAGIVVKDAELAAINITRHKFHGEWNYTIAQKPSVRSDSFPTGPKRPGLDIEFQARKRYSYATR